MTQTVNVNLGGMVFSIDENAYQELDAYLNDIRAHLGSDSVQEIMQDIEARIAELFDQHKKYSHMDVVTLMMVEDVEKQLGSAEAIGGEETPSNSKEETPSNTPEGESEEDGVQEAEVIDSTPHDEQQTKQQGTCKKKLYRDVDNATIGGVCAGLSKWIGIDTVWVRLVMLVLLVFQGVGVLTYLLLWVIVPAANTAARRLEMRGIEPSVDAIKTEVESSPQKYAYGASGSDSGRGGCLVASGCLIMLALLIGFPLLIVAFTLLTAFGAVSGAMNAAFLGVPAMLLKGGLVSALSGLLFILVPIIILLVWLVRRKDSNHPLSKTFLIVMLILWLASLFGMAWGGRNAVKSAANVDWDNWAERVDSMANVLGKNMEFVIEKADSLGHVLDSVNAAKAMEKDYSEGVLEVTEEE